MTTLSNTSVLQSEISIRTYALVQRIEPSVQAVISTLSMWVRRDRERSQLAQLSNHMLSDIGLSRADAVLEINKPFWRA